MIKDKQGPSFSLQDSFLDGSLSLNKKYIIN